MDILNANIVIFTFLSSVFMNLATAQYFDKLHPHLHVDKDTYCEVCKATSEELYNLMNSKTEDLLLSEAWDMLCSHSNFIGKSDKSQAKEMMKACKHLTDTSADGHPEMFEMVSKLFEHDAKVLDIKSAMCNMMSDACKEKRVISDEEMHSMDPEELMVLLNAKAIRKPDPIRQDTKTVTHDAGEL